MIPQIRRGATSTIEHYPPDGVPTSATVAVYGASGEVLVAAGTSATIESTSTTATGAAGSSSLTLGSGSGVTPGRQYWVTTAGGRGQPVVVIDVVSTTATIRGRLVYAVSGASFKGTRISYSFAAPAGTYRDARVEWSYTVNGAAVVRRESLDIVRWPFELSVPRSRIEEACPLYSDLGDGQQFYLQLRDRAERDIFEWLLGRGICPDLVRTRTALESAAVYRVLQLRLETERDRVEAGPWERLFKETCSNFESSRAWYDSDDDMAKAEETSTPDGLRSGASESRVPVKYTPIG